MGEQPSYWVGKNKEDFWTYKCLKTSCLQSAVGIFIYLKESNEAQLLTNSDKKMKNGTWFLPPRGQSGGYCSNQSYKGDLSFIDSSTEHHEDWPLPKEFTQRDI